MIRSVALVPYTRFVPLRGCAVVSEGWWLVLRGDDGVVGRGDAITWPGFGATPDAVADALHRSVPALVGADERDVEAILAGVEPSPARFAAELAWLDLCAQREGTSIAAMLRPDPATDVRSHVLVDSAGAAARAARQGARHFKLKISADVARSAATARAIVHECPGARLRLDANRRLQPSQAERLLVEVAELPIDWLEEPCADPAANRALPRLGIPLAADETVVELGLAAALEWADVAVIKPMFVGGLRAALQLADEAVCAGAWVCVTHALESAVGQRGATAVAAAFRVGVHGVASTEGVCISSAGGRDTELPVAGRAA